MVADSTIYTIVGLVFVAVIGGWVYLETKYKMLVIMKDQTSQVPIIKIHRAMDYTDKDKNHWWKIAGEKKKERKLLPVPPAEVIVINHKGKKVAQCVRTSNGDIVWCKDNIVMQNVPEFIPNEEQTQELEAIKDTEIRKFKFEKLKKEYTDKWNKEHNIISPYQPVTTNQRMGYLSNIRKSEERKKFDWKAQLIPIAAIGSITIILIALMLFWGDIAAPALQADNIVAKMSEEQLQIAQILKEIKTNQQLIGEKIGVAPINQPTPPN